MRRGQRQRQTRGRTPSADGGRDGAIYAKNCRGLLAAPRSWETQGRILPLTLQMESILPTLGFQTFGLQNYEKINFSWFKAPSCGNLLPWKLIQLAIILFAYLLMLFLPLEQIFISLFSLLVLNPHPRIYSLIFERERNVSVTEKHRLVSSHMCPNWRLNRHPLGVRGAAPPSWATLPGLFILFCFSSAQLCV